MKEIANVKVFEEIQKETRLEMACPAGNDDSVCVKLIWGIISNKKTRKRRSNPSFMQRESHLKQPFTGSETPLPLS